MSKKIKFNLRCDNNAVRTLEDLQEHFCVEDVLGYYNSGLLRRWLEVRDYAEQLKRLDALKTKDISDPVQLIEQLAEIFADKDEIGDIEKSTFILKYSQERQKKLEKYAELESAKQIIIADYFEEYDSCIKNIVKNHEQMERYVDMQGYLVLDEDEEETIDENAEIRRNIAAMKAIVHEIADTYTLLLSYDYRRLYYQLKESAPLAVYIMLMEVNIRSLLLNDDSIRAELIQFNRKNIATYFERNSDTTGNLSQWMYPIESVAENTDGMWKTIEYRCGDKDKSGNERGMRCMILDFGQRGSSPASSSSVVKIAEQGEEASPYQVEQLTTDPFPIFDGLAFQSNSSRCYVIYMEV